MQQLSFISSVCKAEWLGASSDQLVRDIISDSRTIKNETDLLFVAIMTQRNNGHHYIADAYAKGVRAFLISQPIEQANYVDATFLLVKDTVQALQLLASQIRQQCTIPVVGITGSNGKTIVKEWLHHLLGSHFNIIRSPKSYNSQIGVPLSVWQMEAHHNLAIFEAGISQSGEMELLEKIIRPSIGIFTNIGEAHTQGFINTRQKINEKLQLFKRAEWLIFCSDYPELNECICLFAQNLKSNLGNALQLFSWSYKHEATLQIKSVVKVNGKTKIVAFFQQKECCIEIPFTDAASIENAIHCWCLLLHFNIEESRIVENMSSLKPISMRLELVQGENNCILINDAYNSDLRSLSIALDMLEQQKQQKKTTVFLSDLQQTGRSEMALYGEVAQILKDRDVQRFFAIGTSLMQNQALFAAHKNVETHFFADTESFLRQIHLYRFADEAILLKGARSFAFEKIMLLLEQKLHQTVLSVNLSALHNNLEVFRRRLKPGVKTMAMVKASSYGSGSHEIATVLQDAQVDYLTVAYADEGVALRKANIHLPIMVMSPSTDAFDRMILWNLEPEIFNRRSLEHFVAVAHNLGVSNYPIHLKLDTGMHRLGFMPDEIDSLLTQLANESSIKIASIFSHLAAADDKDFEAFTRQQADVFQHMCSAIIAAIGYRPLLHLCNTAGIVQYPDYHFDMVRLGLGLYGIDSCGVLNSQLQQISTLRTTIAQIKNISAGETIGYSRRGKAVKDMRIATICIGYADGYPRKLSNGEAFVMINNKAAKLIGNIAMDMCMVDISEIDAVQEGDEVIVFGDALPIQQVAAWADTIPYEIMTSIGQRVKRVYVNEG
jgi:Alr-MurF fusion protein